MENKKNPRLDLQKKQPVFLQIGLILSLSTVLLAFEYRSPPKSFSIIDNSGGQTHLIEMIPITEQAPPKNEAPAIKNLATTIEIVDDLDDSKYDDPDIFDPTRVKDLPRIIPTLIKEKPRVDPPEPPINMEVLAQFPGGDEAMFAWLGSNLTYPDIAKKANIEGTVYVRFVVAVDGTISRIRIERGNLGGGCEEAAMEAVSRMPNWIPARQRNRPAESSYILPIKFQLIH